MIAEFDEKSISTDQVSKLRSQFEAVLGQFCSVSSPECSLAEIEAASNEELAQISDWNKATYDSVQELIHAVVSYTAHKAPNSVAVSA
jgi:hypothetical protein